MREYSDKIYKNVRFLTLVTEPLSLRGCEIHNRSTQMITIRLDIRLAVMYLLVQIIILHFIARCTKMQGTLGSSFRPRN